MNLVHHTRLQGSLAVALAAAMVSGCGNAPEIEVMWEAGQYDSTHDACCHTFTIKGLTEKDMQDGWTIYFSQLPANMENVPDSPCNVEVLMANYFRITPTTSELPEDGTLRASYWSSAVKRHPLAPEGVAIAIGNGKPQKVKFRAIFPEIPDNGEEIYAWNESHKATVPDRFDIIPQVKELKKGDGRIVLGNGIVISDKTHEAEYLKEELRKAGINVLEAMPQDGEKTVAVVFAENEDDCGNPESYSIKAGEQEIMISAGNSAGLFYGAVTLSTIVRQGTPDEICTFEINDWPDLGYRGAMIDIARNFTTPENMKRMIDILAAHKVNTLQFHFCDDEAWRLEIDGLEELTSAGAFHGPYGDDKYLMPSYDGCFDPADKNSTANGFYTKAEFVDMLKYAASRHIKVIPEIESPGHGRAAIKSMEYRARATGDKSFLLSDPDDTSEYLSAQSYTDNVMNVAMESTYKFMETVIDALIAMYDEAGQELDCIHIGGDEVADGAWLGSPVCQNFMKENNMNSAADLKGYYVSRMVDICSARGLKINGWQEMAMHVDKALDPELQPHIMYSFCWNTIPEWGDDHVTYGLANRGYKVICSNVNNTYADMVHSHHPEECGHDWAGKVNEEMSFALQPFNIYSSMREKLDGSPMDLATAHVGKPVLKDSSMIGGVQTQCFAETIRSFDHLTSYMFPKITGVYERGWNACPAWGKLKGKAEKNAFEKDFRDFYGRLLYHQLPYLESCGIAFHVPRPGLKEENGKIYANAPLDGGEIRYTTDGSIPGSDSKLWSSPVEVEPGTVVKARLFLNGGTSVTTKITARK